MHLGWKHYSVVKMSSELHHVLSELSTGIASPREHRARLGHGDGIVRSSGDVADEVVLERGDGRGKFRLFPGVVAQLPVGVPSLGVEDSPVRQEHGVLVPARHLHHPLSAASKRIPSPAQYSGDQVQSVVLVDGRGDQRHRLTGALLVSSAAAINVRDVWSNFGGVFGIFVPADGLPRSPLQILEQRG